MKIAKNLFAGSMVVASAFADVNHAQSQQQSVKKHCSRSWRFCGRYQLGQGYSDP
jgi:hypothetical protein